HWEQLIAIEQLDVENLSPHIKTSMNIKKRIVEEDFKEQNIRKMLNFGHTIGHAIESLFLKNSVIVPHGECVAMGMICETYLAFLEGFLSEQTAENIITNINHFYPKLNINDFSNEEILYLMLNDKKNNSGTIRFSLLDNLGKGNFDVSCQNENI
ncbi:MAG: 3-dehydroquinate synthase, partial [Bergeyella zoohelcum]|nr:3-dehydroquinate synthase [Bergeyella zoohelcum]